MKNNIKKTLTKFWEDLLYFQHFMQILSLPEISDYYHLNAIFLRLQLYFTQVNDEGNEHFVCLCLNQFLLS